MAADDHFDPTHALDGWRLPEPQALDLRLASLLPAAKLAPADIEIRLAQAVPGPQDFDSIHALDGWRAPVPAPLDLQLKSLQRAGRGVDGAKKARLKARGYEMLDVEDIEVPEVRRPVPAVAEVVLTVPVDAEVIAPPEAPPPAVAAPPEPAAPVPAPISAEPEPAMPADTPPSPSPAAAVDAPVLDFHMPAPPAAPDATELLGAISLPKVQPPPAAVDTPVLDFRIAPPPPEPGPQQVLDGIELPDVAPLPTSVEAPVLDMPVPPAPAAPDPRLLAGRRPGAWMAVARRIAKASTEVMQTPDGLSVQNRAAQWLCALWPPLAPDAPRVGRWPELAAVVEAETQTQALQQLLPELPPEALLWPAELDTDWHLVAELVLQQDGQLRPTQARALRELAEVEQQAALARLAEGYELHGRIARRRA